MSRHREIAEGKKSILSKNGNGTCNSSLSGQKYKKTQRDKDWPMIRRLIEAHNHFSPVPYSIKGIQAKLGAFDTEDI